jgi:hypothetical protein
MIPASGRTANTRSLDCARDDRVGEGLPSFARLDSRGRLSPHDFANDRRLTANDGFYSHSIVPGGFEVMS